MVAFNEVLPWDGQCTPVFQKDGRNILRLCYPAAHRVELLFADQRYVFSPSDGGSWELELPFHTGINYVQLFVDDIPVLSPLLPIMYGYSRPYNCIEIRTEGDEFYQLRDVPHGCVRQEYFFSSVTGEWERCFVYTPPGYEEHPEKVYPVLYLQHGHGENETGWTAAGRAHLILDNLLSAGRAVPFLIVMNNGMVQKKVTHADGRAEHIVDHLLLEPMLIKDVIPAIEARYHAGRSRERRGMAGLSMGSIQTAMTVMNHPKMFSEAGIFSGFLHDWISGSQLDMSGHEPNINTHLQLMANPEFPGLFRTFFRGIGDEDPFLEHFLADDSLCSTCTRKIYHGTHDWNVWRQCFYDFAQMIFQQEVPEA